jgi:hypothetical protein
MSIASQCPSCCDCPVPVVQWDSVSASLTKCGYLAKNGLIYLRAEGSGTITTSAYSCGTRQQTLAGALIITPPSCSASSDMVLTCTQAPECEEDPEYLDVPPNASNIVNSDYLFPQLEALAAVCNGFSSSARASSPTTISVNGTGSLSGSLTFTFASEYTTALLKTNTLAALPAYDDDWNDAAGSFANLSTDELSYSIRESRYRIRFEAPQTGTGKCYRVSWVERFVPEAGVGLTSIAVLSPGEYRPAVDIDPPPSGGTQAAAVAVMSSDGEVASIRILHPGSGYVSAPTVTVEAATMGGATATGWTATLSAEGQVSAITGGTGGDYLPIVGVIGSGGSGATATAVMDAQGGIASVTVDSAGSGYTTLIVGADGVFEDFIAADLLPSFGTETERCVEWGGELPEDYNPEDPDTWPILGDGTNPYFELPVPEEDGLTSVANVRAFCDCAACPEPEEEP